MTSRLEMEWIVPKGKADLTGMDLNLLMTLDALILERSVTRAAARMGVRQPAMSSSLAKLRRLFGDELLTRSPDGMRLTPRAAALAEPLNAILRDIRALVVPTNFDPAKTARTFSIAVPDALELLFIPDLLARCCDQAPGITILARPLERTAYGVDLDSDNLDLALGFSMVSQSHHRQRTLFQERYVVIYDDSRLGVGAPIPLKDYVRVPHVVTSYGNAPRGAIDDALKAAGETRGIRIRTSRFLMMPHLLRAAPVLATTGSRFAERLARSDGLTVSPPPIDLPPFSVNMVWHASYDADPAHRWLRQAIIDQAHALG